MIRQDTTTWTFSNDPFRGILVAPEWSDVAEPDREPFDEAGRREAARGQVVPLPGSRPALMSATTSTRINPDREPIAS